MLFDASAYMLFEESGDSEAQYFDGAFELEADAPAETAAAEDDAQSCSYGSLSYSARLHEVDAGADHDFRGADLDDWSGDEEDDGGGSDEDDGVVDQCCRRGKAAAAAMEKPTKSKACEDSKVKMNEREGDRLFWEACLAS